MKTNNSGVTEYIRQAIKQGESIESIKGGLRRSGYGKDEIERFFEGFVETRDGKKSMGKTAPNGAKKVLIVEDDKFLHEIVVKKMISVGFDVKNAVNSKETFDIFDSGWHPAIILLDLILPGEGGFSILEKIKKDPQLAAVPVVVLSNLGQENDKQRAATLGAVDFMIKSNFTLDEIVKRVISLIG